MANITYVIEKLIKLREQNSYTQEEIAQTLGLSRQSYILVEKGQRDLNTQELELLAAKYGIDIADLFDEIPNLEKFKQMYFVCLEFAANSHGNVTKTMLAKLLYLADFANFYEALEPMSGVKYRRMEYGPVADIFFSMTDDLLESGKIKVQVLDRGAQMISLNTREAKTNLLSNEELDRIKTICEAWKDKPTQDIINFTHEQLPWKMCRNGEYIPYSLIIQEDPEHVYQPLTR